MSTIFLLKKKNILEKYSKRRRRDLNPRAAINDLLPFQGSPFSLLGTSPKTLSLLVSTRRSFFASGEGGIRTHVPLRTNGFQDRLVMTSSIPLHNSYVFCFCISVRRKSYSSRQVYNCQHLF